MRDTQVWNTEHPVLQIIHSRRDSESRPSMREPNDVAKVGLAVEGGGMRGVVSASMLAALEDLGFRDSFDAIYGVSAGAINAAFFLAGQIWYSSSIYYDDLVTGRFLDFSRTLRQQSIMDLSYLIDEVMENIKPLNYERVLRSPIPLHIAVTDVDQQRTLVEVGFETVTEMREALRAGCWLPIGVRGTATYRNQRAIDGGVLVSAPYRMALQDGCTHVLCLSTRQIGSRLPMSSAMNRYVRLHLNRLNSGLGDGYLRTITAKRADDVRLREMSVRPKRTSPHVLEIAPLPGSPQIGRHEVRHHRLLSSARRAYEIMWATLHGRPAAEVTNGLIRAVPHFNVVTKGGLVDF